MSSFKIGDRVKVINPQLWAFGCIGTVIKVDKFIKVILDSSKFTNNLLHAYRIDELELIETIGCKKLDTSTKPKVLTLPTDSKDRKDYPLTSGCLKYFPAALAGVSNISKKGNDKHNPGEPLHHARGKSMDHSDCIVRHLMDTEDLLAARSRGTDISNEQILTEANQLAWRALAYVQELHEQLGAPMAPGAKE